MVCSFLYKLFFRGSYYFFMFSLFCSFHFILILVSRFVSLRLCLLLFHPHLVLVSRFDYVSPEHKHTLILPSSVTSSCAFKNLTLTYLGKQKLTIGIQPFILKKKEEIFSLTHKKRTMSNSEHNFKVIQKLFHMRGTDDWPICLELWNGFVSNETFLIHLNETEVVWNEMRDWRACLYIITNRDGQRQMSLAKCRHIFVVASKF